jgi:fido (protein-threonine AMPylation protein)
MSPGDIHPPDCPGFEYEHHPERATAIPQRVCQIVTGLRAGTIDAASSASDTRTIHHTLFTGLTPAGHPYFAGHYRGEEYRCLRRYMVQVGNRVCPPAHIVLGMMTDVANNIRGAIAALDAGHAIPNSVIPQEVKLLHTVQVACRFFEMVCRVHPYANGNGHAARFCLWAILARYGYFPNTWTIDPRPLDPPYTPLLLAYRAGNHDGFEQHILGCLI